MRMRAVVLERPGVLKMIDKDYPEIEDDEVLVKVCVCGICGSDLHAYNGASPDIQPPIVLGHEFTGVIVETGGSVQNLQVGERVCVNPLITCGQCFFCLIHQDNRCQKIGVLGCQIDGAFAEYVAVKAKRVYRLPTNVSCEEGALLEPLAVAVHAVRHTLRGMVNAAAVFGVGAVGNLVIQVLKNLNVPLIIAVDLLSWRLNLAKKMGATTVLDARYEDVVKKILALTNGLGADASFEVAGQRLALEQALEGTRKGGYIALIGLHEEENVPLPLATVTFKELSIIGNAVYDNTDFETALELLKTRKVNPTPLITHVFPLEEASKAFEVLTRRSEPAVKVLLRISQES